MKIKGAVLRETNKPYSIEELELEPPKEKEAPKPDSGKKRPEATHIDQLLQAKRRKAGHDKDKGATDE